MFVIVLVWAVGTGNVGNILKVLGLRVRKLIFWVFFPIPTPISFHVNSK